MYQVVSPAFPSEFEARRFDKLQKYPQLSATGGARPCTDGEFVAARCDGLLPCPASKPNLHRVIQTECRRRTAPSASSYPPIEPGVIWSKGCSASRLRASSREIAAKLVGFGRNVEIEPSFKQEKPRHNRR